MYSTLEVCGAMVTDEGEYMCGLNSTTGAVNGSFLLNVLGKWLGGRGGREEREQQGERGRGRRGKIL